MRKLIVIEIAKEYRVALPAWIEHELTGVPDVVADREERMRLVHRLADRNWREGTAARSRRSSPSATPAGSCRSG
jgi:hypothetical protein